MITTQRECMLMRVDTFTIGAVVLVFWGSAVAQGAVAPEARAAATESQMTDPERVILTNGIVPLASIPGPKPPTDAIAAAGYVPGVPRLGVPSLKETDASLGVSWMSGVRSGDDGATALPSGSAIASTWNPLLARRGGEIIGADAKSKGFNVMLAGGANLIRDPRNGRTFEYMSEDPLLTGILVGEEVAGIQSNHIISTVKHFALNDQESARDFVDSRISEASARESDLLAFEIAIERGKPGSVMCSYNRVNGPYACDNEWLLNEVLKRDWAFKGFVMSDWGAVHRVETALHGLDQQSGSQSDKQVWLGAPLGKLAANDPTYAARVHDMNRRILYSIYAAGLDSDPPVKAARDQAAGLAVAEAVAREGIVLLRNERNVLPLLVSQQKIAVIGGYADTGVLSGGGSSQVQGEGGPAASIPIGGDSPFARAVTEQYQRSNPLAAIKAHAIGSQVTFTRGNYLSAAVQAARNADVVIIFATEWRSEGFDASSDLSLPDGQDALIAAVAEVNSRTIVVLQSGGPILMPWLSKTAAVVEAWYPGGRGGEAIASILFGETNPSGRLPVTFPMSIQDLPRPILDGAWINSLSPDVLPTEDIRANYDIEGSDVGYRWYAREGKSVLFPFGFGLSYTSFTYDTMTLSVGKQVVAQFTVRNTGKREGADVPQLYLTSAAGRRLQRLAAFEKVDLKPGEMRHVTVTVDPRILAEWDTSTNGWRIHSGIYEFALGASAADLRQRAAVRLGARRLEP
jgi:beta-glucosidase